LPQSKQKLLGWLPKSSIKWCWLLSAT